MVEWRGRGSAGRVERTEFDTAGRRLELHLDCEASGIFDHRTYLHARVRRVRFPARRVKEAKVPWSESGAGFVPWFDALVVAFAREMRGRALAQPVGEHDARLWQLLYATRGGSAPIFHGLQEGDEAHGGQAERIRGPWMDGHVGGSYEGPRDAFPAIGITLDCFHMQRVMNRAVDEVGRAEREKHPKLNRTSYVRLKRRGKLTASWRERLEELLNPAGQGLKTVFASRVGLAFEAFLALPPRLAEVLRRREVLLGGESGLQPIIDAAKTIRKPWDGVLLGSARGSRKAWIEGINSPVQAAKARARGCYGNTENLITIAYLVRAILDFKLST